MASIFTSGVFEGFDSNGDPLAGGKLYTYAAGTTTPLASYTNQGGGTPNANPVVLDSAGRANVWLGSSAYRLLLKTSADVTVWDTDNVRTSAFESAADFATLAASTGSSLVGHIATGTGAVAMTVQTKLRESKSDADFGAVGDGVADDTAALKALFDYCVPIGAVAVLTKPSYLVTGPIQPWVLRASGSMHIFCLGNVVITVDAASTAFRDLLYCETTAANNGSITGGSLYIDCNNKAASGISFRHAGATQSGAVNISAQVTVVNCKNNDAAAVYENQGILVTGDYASIVMQQPKVIGVDRTNTAAGACKGISIQGFSGEVVLHQPYVKNVLCTGGTVDADGIGTFGKAIGTTYNASAGKVTLHEPVFVDCQGRSLKSQCSDTTLIRPKVLRQMVVSIAQGIDFDFQYGNGIVIEPQFEYRLNGATTPLGTSFTPIFFQQLLDNVQMYAKCVGGVLMTEVLLPSRFAAATHQSGSLESLTEVIGLKVIPLGSLATNTVTRAILESRMDTVVAKSTKTKFIVRGVQGPLQCHIIGYTDYTAGSLAAKLSFEVTDCVNTLASVGRPFRNLSGTAIAEVDLFNLRNNYGFIVLDPLSTYSFNKLIPGCKFTVSVNTTIATNPPPWDTSWSHYALIESLEDFFGAGFRSVRVTLDNGAKQSHHFYTDDGGTTWSSNVPSADSAANIAAVAAAVNTRNKIAGLTVRDTTNNRLMVSTGALAASPWYVADGSASVTPS